MRICLQEIRRCQQVTPHPNFVVLLGQRYGWRPVPAAIPVAEFAPILAATSDPEHHALLEQWYVRDDNAVPPEYVLSRVRKAASMRIRTIGRKSKRSYGL